MSPLTGDFSFLCNKNTKYFWPWVSFQDCLTCCFLVLLSLELVVFSHVYTVQLSLQGLSLKISGCVLTLSLSLILYSLTFQNSAILLISENSEISLLNLMRLPGSVWVFPPYAVAWNIFPGREVGHSQNCICLLLFLGVMHFLVHGHDKHCLIYLILSSNFLRRKVKSSPFYSVIITWECPSLFGF